MSSQQVSDPLAVLQRIRENRTAAREAAAAEESCDLCREVIAPDHGHLVDLKARNLMCACRGCYLLFSSGGAGGGHFRAIPDRYKSFPDFRLTQAQWDSLQIPVSVAFLFVNSSMDRLAAFYPGPAGATESLLSLDAWEELVAAHDDLRDMQPDVEAFLVRSQRGEAGAECYIVPIDACYELVGRLRTLWRGFDGGQEANAAIEDFFATVQARAR